MLRSDALQPAPKMMKSVLSGTIVVVIIETFTQAYQGATIGVNLIPGPMK